MKELKLTLNGKEFYADVFEDKAPKIVAALEALGKFDSPLISAKICNEEIYYFTDAFLDEFENPQYDQEPGNIGFFPKRQCICIFYGDLDAVGYCNVFAKIKATDLPGFYKEAKTVWQNQGAVITTEFVERG
jgi:hypothetical protein